MGVSAGPRLRQVPDLESSRRRVADLATCVIWMTDLPGMAGTHLHPKDVSEPSCRWTGRRRRRRGGGRARRGRGERPTMGPAATGLTVEVNDPSAAARRRAAVLELSAERQLRVRGRMT